MNSDLLQRKRPAASYLEGLPWKGAQLLQKLHSTSEEGGLRAFPSKASVWTRWPDNDDLKNSRVDPVGLAGFLWSGLPITGFQRRFQMCTRQRTPPALWPSSVPDVSPVEAAKSWSNIRKQMTYFSHSVQKRGSFYGNAPLKEFNQRWLNSYWVLIHVYAHLWLLNCDKLRAEFLISVIYEHSYYQSILN